MPDSPAYPSWRRSARICAAALLVGLAFAQPPAAAQSAGEAGEAEQQVYAHTLRHQQAHEALILVRPLLTADGSVEVQPGGNTLVIRESPVVLLRVARLLQEFDHPPENLRFEIQIVRAGPQNRGISPPLPEPPSRGELSKESVERLRKLLRFDEYRVLAEAGLPTREGQEVKYAALGDDYTVSFRAGPVLAGKRVKLEGFRILKQAPQVSDKGRRLEPRELFHANLNLWLDRPFNLVLEQDASRDEALMVVISCRRERVVSPSSAAAEKTPTELRKRPAGGGR